MKRYHIELDVHLGGTVAVEDIKGAFCYHADAEAEVARLTARLAKLEAVRYHAEIISRRLDTGLPHVNALLYLQRTIKACPPAPVCKTCDGARGVVAGVEGWPKTIIPCPSCQPAPKEEP